MVHRGRQPLAERPLPAAALPLLERHQPHDVVEAKLLDLRVGHVRHLLEVVLRARRDRVEGERLGHAAPERHAHAVHQLLRAVQLLVDRRVLREPQRGAGARQYGHLKRIRNW